MSDHKDELRMYIVVNNDAKMGKGKVAAQVGHAVMMAVAHLIKNDQKLYSRYSQSGMAKIVLKANLETIEQLASAHKNVFVVRDAGRTQIESGTLTAVGFLPMTEHIRDKQYPMLSSLKLL